MNNAWTRIKETWNENPLLVIGVVGFAATAAATLIDSTSNAASRRTWDREVARRERMTYGR